MHDKKQRIYKKYLYCFISISILTLLLNSMVGKAHARLLEYLPLGWYSDLLTIRGKP